MRYRYPYQNSGHPILSWKDGPPRQTRAADNVALGSLGGDTLGVLPLAQPGAPEPVGDCGCSGPCSGPPGPLHGVPFANVPSAVLVGGAAVLAYFLFFRKRK